MSAVCLSCGCCVSVVYLQYMSAVCLLCICGMSAVYFCSVSVVCLSLIDSIYVCTWSRIMSHVFEHICISAMYWQ